MLWLSGEVLSGPKHRIFAAIYKYSIQNMSSFGPLTQSTTALGCDTAPVALGQEVLAAMRSVRRARMCVCVGACTRHTHT